jgi:hypothetical protein
MLVAATVISCGGNNRNESDHSASENAEESVDDNSGDNISPQLKDSADRFKIDTIKPATSADKAKQMDLEKQ